MKNSIEKEAQQQAAWEQVLRGERVPEDVMDKDAQASADAVRSYIVWQQLAKEPQAINEIEREQVWKRLSPRILPEKDARNVGLSKWWMGVAASVVLGLVIIPLLKEPKTDSVLNPKGIDETAWVEKGNGMTIYESKLVESPKEYAENLRMTLIETGFQVSPLKADGDSYLLRMRAVGDVNVSMQSLLDKHDLWLNHAKEASLKISQKVVD